MLIKFRFIWFTWGIFANVWIKHCIRLERTILIDCVLEYYASGFARKNGKTASVLYAFLILRRLLIAVVVVQEYWCSHHELLKQESLVVTPWQPWRQRRCRLTWIIACYKRCAESSDLWYGPRQEVFLRLYRRFGLLQSEIVSYATLLRSWH